MAGLSVGDERDLAVPAEGAYGEYDGELVLEIERSEPSGSEGREGRATSSLRSRPTGTR